jgi:hypothetical protein
MRFAPWLTAVARADVRVEELAQLRHAGVEAYDLVGQLPRGPARLAAWNAYVFQTYADKLIAASPAKGYVRVATAQFAQELYGCVGGCLDQARQVAALPDGSRKTDPTPPMPHWHTPVRAQEELCGMRDTLDVLRTYVAYDLSTLQVDKPSLERLQDVLTVINARFEVEGLWLPRTSPELRGKIGDLLTDGLDQAYALGQVLAEPALLDRSRLRFP